MTVGKFVNYSLGNSPEIFKILNEYPTFRQLFFFQCYLQNIGSLGHYVDRCEITKKTRGFRNRPRPSINFFTTFTMMDISGSG